MLGLTSILLNKSDMEYNVLARKAYDYLGGNDVGPFAFAALGVGLCCGAVEVLKMIDKTWTGTMPTIKNMVLKKQFFILQLSVIPWLVFIIF